MAPGGRGARVCLGLQFAFYARRATVRPASRPVPPGPGPASRRDPPSPLPPLVVAPGGRGARVCQGLQFAFYARRENKFINFSGPERPRDKLSRLRLTLRICGHEKIVKRPKNPRQDGQNRQGVQ